MKKAIVKAFVFVSLAGVGPMALAAPQVLTVSSGSTKFLAIGRPSLLKIRGEGSGPSGKLSLQNNTVAGELEVDLTSFTTGVDMRDDHMKNKYLEVEKYPKAILKLSGLKIPPMDQLPKEVPFEGTLTLHGQTAPVKEGKVLLSKEGSKVKFDAKFKTDITSYKIEIPSYAGIKVAEVVDVEVSSVADTAGAASKEVAKK